MPVADRASSFGPAAATYAAVRPGYPVEAVRWAVEQADPLTRVVDVGAGTGKLTAAVLAALPHVQVTAVERDAEMLAALDLPVAKVLAPAEATTLADGEADAVLVGQAWHWFDQAAAAAEMARILRPGGVLALVANLHDGADPRLHELFVAMLTQDSLVVQDDELTWDVPGFAPLERRRFDHVQTLTIDDTVRLVHSFSRWLVASPEEQAATDEQVRALAAPLADLAGVLQLPYRTYVWRTQPP